MGSHQEFSMHQACWLSGRLRVAMVGLESAPFRFCDCTCQCRHLWKDLQSCWLICFMLPECMRICQRDADKPWRQTVDVQASSNHLCINLFGQFPASLRCYLHVIINLTVISNEQWDRYQGSVTQTCCWCRQIVKAKVIWMRENIYKSNIMFISLSWTFLPYWLFVDLFCRLDGWNLLFKGVGSTIFKLQAGFMKLGGFKDVA